MPASRPARAALGGRFVTLRPLGEADFGALFDVIGHPEVFAGGYGGGAAALRESREEFADWLRGYLPWEAGLAFGVWLRGGPHDGELVGTSSLGDLDLKNEGAHIGWTAYNPRVWGSVVNAEAKLLLLSLAFEHGFSRVKLQADAANERSRAAILRLGATFEGVLRHERRRADGSWRDTAIHSVLVEEWPRVRDGLEARLHAQGARPVLYRGTR